MAAPPARLLTRGAGGPPSAPPPPRARQPPARSRRPPPRPRIRPGRPGALPPPRPHPEPAMQPAAVAFPAYDFYTTEQLLEAYREGPERLRVARAGVTMEQTRARPRPASGR